MRAFYTYIDANGRFFGAKNQPEKVYSCLYEKFYLYGFNNQESDDEIKGSGNSYDFGARMYDGRIGKFLSLDRYAAKFAYQSPYIFAANTPIQAIDMNGDSVWVFATTLPGTSSSSALSPATHTFIIVKTSDGQMHYFAYGPENSDNFLGGSLSQN